MNNIGDEQNVIERVFLEETRLNASIVESIFRYFVLAVCFFALGMFAGLGILGDGEDISGYYIWTIFVAQISLFFVSRYLPEDKKIALPALLVISMIMGTLLVPYLFFIGNEFGNSIVGKALIITGLIFSASAILGWIKENFMSSFLTVSKYLLALMLFVALVSPMISWSHEGEIIFAALCALFIFAMTIFDFQKLRYYPKRAEVAASLHIFMNLILIFTLMLRLLTGLTYD